MAVLRVLFVVVAMLVITAPRCAHKDTPAQKGRSGRAAVYGTVRGSPPKGMPPAGPATEASVVAGARVALREFVARDQLAGAEVASSVTDSAGAYRLEAPPGTYFLVVTHARIPHAMVTSGYLDKNFSREDSVNAFRVIELSTDRQEDVTIPQAWPE